MLLLGALALAAAAADPGGSDVRASFPPEVLHNVLRARGLTCEGCSQDALMDKIRSSDDVGRKLASGGNLAVLVRYWCVCTP